jgi:perosamine synthetase
MVKNMDEMIPLYKPHMPELPEMNSILTSGRLAYGKYGREFENQLKTYLGTKNVLVTNTFNMAILVSLTSLDIQYGDAVIASPMACLASSQPLLSMDLKVVWADVDPKRGTLDPESVKRKIQANPKVKAIIHNHFCGYPGYLDEVQAVASKFGIPTIDDGIEAFGSEYKGRKIGNVGSDVTFFSFNPVRIPNTLDGGAVVFKDKTAYEKAILVRDAGIDRNRFRDDIGEINANCDISIAGHSATPMEVNSYIGIEQMKSVKELLKKQRKNAAVWDHEFKVKAITGIQAMDTTNITPNYWVYGLLSSAKREEILSFRAQGYYASGVHINNNRYSAFGKYELLPGVEEFNNTFLAIPSGWWFSK